MRKSLPFILILTQFCFLAQSQISWNSQINIAPSSSGNNHPRIVTDASGNPLVTWFHASRVMFSRWNGTGFETPRILNPVSMTVAGASWMGPDIAAKGDTIYIVFKETPEDVGHLWIIHSFDGGAIFSDPVQIDSIGSDFSRFPTVTIDETGNPIVAFMKFDAGFSNARWVVTRSEDFGESFSPDVLASGWSSQSSVVCDCCPGSIVSADNTVAMLYRDNKNNIRDTWAGFSTDGGSSFTSGINIDRLNWMVHACPASGPDGVIVGDTLYSTFMNGASGKVMVYMNRTSLTETDPSPGVNVTTNNSNVSLQNFPRIAAHDQALGITWMQVSNGVEQILIRFTNDLSGELPAIIDTVDEHNIMNVDLAIHDGNIFVVWEDNGSGTVKFRSGTFQNQDEIGFLDSTYVWIEVYTDVFVPNMASLKYTVAHDSTLVEDKYYFKVLKTNSELSEQWTGTGRLIRYENGIVYEPWGVGERQLYNFNLAIGDTFNLNSGFDTQLVVHMTDSISLLNGEKRKRWKLHCVGDDPPFQFGVTEWIEGIGNINGLFLNDETCLFDVGGSTISCLYRNDTLLYDDPELDGCWFMTTSTVNAELNDIFFVPNPAFDLIDIVGLQQEIKSIRIFNSVGALVYTGNNKRIDLHSFSSGYYYAVIELSDNNMMTNGFIKY